jgi:hypothetical protein
VQLRPKSWQRHVSALGRAAIVQEALERAQAYRVYLEWALGQPGIKGRPISFRQTAIRLNDRNIETPLGGTWRGHHLQRMARRLGIDHPLARMPDKVAREQIRILWERRPDITCKDAVADLGTPHPLDGGRTRAYLKECQQEAARRSFVHRRVGWSLDHRTVARIRVGEMWRRHPEFTAKQVAEKLKLTPDVSLKWVHRILNQCWKAFAKPKPKDRRKGRRSYDPWRNHSLPLKGVAP